MESKSFKVVLMRCCQREEKELETSEEAAKWEKMTKGDGNPKKKMVISGISRCLFCLLIPEQKFRFGISNPLKSARTRGDVAALDDLWWVDAPLFRP